MNLTFIPIFDQFFGGLVRGYDPAEPDSDPPGSDECGECGQEEAAEVPEFDHGNPVG